MDKSIQGNMFKKDIHNRVKKGWKFYRVVVADESENALSFFVTAENLGVKNYRQLQQLVRRNHSETYPAHQTENVGFVTSVVEDLDTVQPRNTWIIY